MYLKKRYALRKFGRIGYDSNVIDHVLDHDSFVLVFSLGIAKAERISLRIIARKSGSINLIIV